MARSLTLVAAIASIVTVGGCPTTTPSLTADEQAGVQDVVAQVMALSAALSTTGSLGDAQLDPDSIAATGTFGTCPAVTFTADAGNAVITFDFGTGCTATLNANQIIVGTVQIGLARATRTVVANFDNFSIDARSVTGQIQATLTRITSGVGLEGLLNLSTALVGSAVGTYAAQITTAGLITIPSATLVISDDEGNRNITLTNIVIDPASNGNFVPEAGTAAIEIPLTQILTPGAARIVITFDENSPVDGTVSVQVGSQAAIDYDVPGIADDAP